MANAVATCDDGIHVGVDKDIVEVYSHLSRGSSIGYLHLIPLRAAA